MIVQIQGQQRADIETEDQFFVNTLRQHGRVQSVQALYNDHGIGLQLKPVTLPLPAAGEEIEGGQFHFLSPQKPCHILPEQRRVQRVDVLQIEFPVRPGGDFVPVDVVIVQTHENRLFPMHPQLGCQPVGGGGFTGRAGPGQHDRFRAPLAHLIRDSGEVLLMQRLVDTDQLPNPPGNGQLVQIGHRLAFHQFTPALPLFKHAEEIRRIQTGRHAVRISVIRTDKQKSILRRFDVPHRQIPRGRHHLSIVVVGKISIGILIKIIHGAPAQQPCFVRISVGFKVGNCFLQRHPAPLQRDIRSNQLPYLPLQLFG